MTCGPERRDPIPDAERLRHSRSELMLSLPIKDWRTLFRADTNAGHADAMERLKQQFARQLAAMGESAGCVTIEI